MFTSVGRLGGGREGDGGGLVGRGLGRALPGCVHVLKFNETFMIHILF